MKLLQINTTVNSGSTGRIAEDIGRVAMANGHESYIAFGRGDRPSQSQLLRIGSKADMYLHGLQTLLFDRHGLASAAPTEKLIGQIAALKPDIVHLHNLHGYYLHAGKLAGFLQKFARPIVWTLHDCWAFTGHCAFFDDIGCERWQTGCYQCPKKNRYPASWGLDRSKQNYADKKAWFSKLPHLHIVTPSRWLAQLVGQSFLKNHPVEVIHNGIDLQQFKPIAEAENLLQKYPIGGRKILLGVASIWDRRKGLDDFMQLNRLITKDFVVALVGLSPAQMKNLPPDIIGIPRTESIRELAAWYTAATAFVNPTWQDNFPTTNLEALACGTPVITYDTGGSPEAIDPQTGFVVAKGDTAGIWQAVQQVATQGKAHYLPLCRARAEAHFNKEDRYRDYLRLYENLLMYETAGRDFVR
jgi:glycosyltransferase involved in cell wall biosynthesis